MLVENGGVVGFAELYGEKPVVGLARVAVGLDFVTLPVSLPVLIGMIVVGNLSDSDQPDAKEVCLPCFSVNIPDLPALW
ncbi:hypothetical protein ACFL59_06890 [Planctomycetota bacterium]